MLEQKNEGKAQIANQEQEIESKMLCLNNVSSPHSHTPQVKHRQIFMDCAFGGKSIAPCIWREISVQLWQSPIPKKEVNFWE